MISRTQLSTGIAVVVALAFFIYFFITGGMSNLFSGGSAANGQNTAQQNAASGALSQNSIVVQDVAVGTGAAAQAGDLVQVDYVGKLQDGTIFDRSADHGGSFQFTLGAHEVIQGWDEGIAGMKVGGERVLIIPPAFGYGAQAVGPIPANSTLIFDVKLLGVSPSNKGVPGAPEGSAAN